MHQRGDQTKIRAWQDVPNRALGPRGFWLLLPAYGCFCRLLQTFLLPLLQPAAPGMPAMPIYRWPC